jgi:hypothetical protein
MACGFVFGMAVGGIASAGVIYAFYRVFKYDKQWREARDAREKQWDAYAAQARKPTQTMMHDPRDLEEAFAEVAQVLADYNSKRDPEGRNNMRANRTMRQVLAVFNELPLAVAAREEAARRAAARAAWDDDDW